LALSIFPLERMNVFVWVFADNASTHFARRKFATVAIRELMDELKLTLLGWAIATVFEQSFPHHVVSELPVAAGSVFIPFGHWMIVILVNWDREFDRILDAEPHALSRPLNLRSHGANEREMEVPGVIETGSHSAQIVNLRAIRIKSKVLDAEMANDFLMLVIVNLNPLPQKRLLTVLHKIDRLNAHEPKTEPLLAAFQFLNYDWRNNLRFGLLNVFDSVCNLREHSVISQKTHLLSITRLRKLHGSNNARHASIMNCVFVARED